ncbi:uncharacterized protein PSFLO_02794 [Pseudozyma flocculosa]|uniref:Zn(2)-C6 fungal-type domain-containing protein n=1 Tax=Pseudozyma flocculosa TaxID=84751 RepID=A0A5C3F206_9BASI|nr:uncharacterized protein PSFLO_02794 [Pseudozyma flocculosa]
MSTNRINSNTGAAAAASNSTPSMAIPSTSSSTQASVSAPYTSHGHQHHHHHQQQQQQQQYHHQSQHRATSSSISPSINPQYSLEPSPRSSRPAPPGPPSQERPSKRSRVRQACNRCKARKIKCGDLRPCENCTSLGLVCKDWRPGEDAQHISPSNASTSAASASAATGLHGYHSGSDHEPSVSSHRYPPDLHSRAGLQYRATPTTPGPPAAAAAATTGHPSSSSSSSSAAFATPVSDPRSSVHFRTQGGAAGGPSQFRSSESSEPPASTMWPNTPYERSTHSVAWPPRPDLRRHRYLAYPFDSLYRNEFGHLKALSLSSGLGTLSYLHEYHKLANEQFLDALWQVLEGDAHDTGNTQMFALESEIFSPHALASLGQMTDVAGGIAHPPLGATGQQGLVDYDWSLGGLGLGGGGGTGSGLGSINVPHTYNSSLAMAPQPNMEGITTRAPSSASVRLTVSPAAKPESRASTTSPHPQETAAATLTSTSASTFARPQGVSAGGNRTSRDAKPAQDTPSRSEAAEDAKPTLTSPSQPALADPETAPTDMWAYMDSKIPPQHRRFLVHTFLSTTYVLWPTFLLSEFLETLKDAEQRKNPTFVCLVIACCAIAAREEAGSIKGGAAAEWGSSFGFFELYLDVRRYAPRSTDWASLNHIQALFYLSHYCFGASGPYGVHRAHYLMNGCVSKCFDVGLHRSAETYTDAFTASEIEARRRTLWAVYCGDKVSAAYGRPVLLRLSDIDVAEIDTDSPAYDERLPASNSFDQAYSMRPYHRAAIRLFCVLERVIDKINLPACSSSAALERLMRKKPKRPRQSANHDDSCMADHEPIGFSEELELVDMFQTADTPTPTTTHQDDPMFHAHIERLRTTAAFIKIFIYRHLFCMANTNLSREPPRLDYRDEMVKWCRELLLSQRKMIRRGEYTDFGSVMSYQLSQTGRGLIPAIYISSRLIDPSQDPNGATIIKESKELLVLAYDLLRTLSSRFSASHRQLQIMQQAFKRLDLSLKRRHHHHPHHHHHHGHAGSGAAGSGTAHHHHSSHVGGGGDGAVGATTAEGGGAGTEDGRSGGGGNGHVAGGIGIGVGGGGGVGVGMLGGSSSSTATSGLDLIAGVAGADGLGFEGEATSNEELDEIEEGDEIEEEDDEGGRDKKPGWISDLPINAPVEKGAPHTVNAYIGWPNNPTTTTSSSSTSGGGAGAATVESTTSGTATATAATGGTGAAGAGAGATTGTGTGTNSMGAP